MTNRFHGVFSLILLLIALGLANYILFIDTTFGWYYLATVVLGFIGIAGVFCTRCEAAPNNCSHVFIGYLTKLFPIQKTGKYKAWEYLVTAIILIIVFGAPQYWLWNNLYYFIAFWALAAIAGLEINSFVCKKCLNKKCAMCKSIKKGKHSYPLAKGD